MIVSDAKQDAPVPTVGTWPEKGWLAHSHGEDFACRCIRCSWAVGSGQSTPLRWKEAPLRPDQATQLLRCQTGATWRYPAGA